MVDLSITNIVPKVNTSAVLNTVLVLAAVLLAIGIIGYIVWYQMREKKYKQYVVRVLDKDSNGKAYEWPDKAGVFLDKSTGYRLLFLRKAKVGMNPNKIPYISRLDNKGRIIKIVTVRRIGVNNYVFVDINIGEATKFTVGEEDLNNAHQEMTKIRRSYNKDNWLSKLAPYIMFIITILIVMIILISLFNKMGVIDDASKNLLAVAEQNQVTTSLLYNLTTKTEATQVPIIRPTGT